MANREACEVYIDQEIKSGLDDGKTPYKIGQEVSDWIAKLFEVRINVKTIETRALRAKKKNTSNEVKESKGADINTDSIKGRHPQGGGKREGAGRPVKIDINESRMDVVINKIIENEKIAMVHIKNYMESTDTPRLQGKIFCGSILSWLELIDKTIKFAPSSEYWPISDSIQIAYELSRLLDWFNYKNKDKEIVT